MKQFHYIIVFFYILLNAQALGFQGWMVITGSRILEEDAFISCSYVLSPGEEVSYVFILPPPFNDTVFYFMIALNTEVYSGTSYHNRVSATVNSSHITGITDAVTTVTMTIENLQCSDEHEYACSFQYRTGGQLTLNNEVASLELIVRVPPSPPEVILESSDLGPKRGEVWLLEESVILAKCKANVGRPGLGTLRWKVFRNNALEYVYHNDSRVRTVSNYTVNCSEHMEQWLTMEVMKGDQNLLIGCFVHNSDFPVNETRLHCLNTSSQLCDETPEFAIFSADADDEATGFLVAGLVLVAGFLTAVVVDIIYHCFCVKKTPPKRPSVDKAPEPEEPESEAFEENESIQEEESEESDAGTRV